MRRRGAPGLDGPRRRSSPQAPSCPRRRDRGTLHEGSARIVQIATADGIVVGVEVSASSVGAAAPDRVPGAVVGVAAESARVIDQTAPDRVEGTVVGSGVCAGGVELAAPDRVGFRFGAQGFVGVAAADRGGSGGCGVGSPPPDRGVVAAREVAPAAADRCMTPARGVVLAAGHGGLCPRGGVQCSRDDLPGDVQAIDRRGRADTDVAGRLADEELAAQGIEPSERGGARGREARARVRLVADRFGARRQRGRGVRAGRGRRAPSGGRLGSEVGRPSKARTPTRRGVGGSGEGERMGRGRIRGARPARGRAVGSTAEPELDRLEEASVEPAPDAARRLRHHVQVEPAVAVLVQPVGVQHGLLDREACVDRDVHEAPRLAA
jgi:hypothetical protein